MSIVGANTLVFPGLRVKDIFNHEITGKARSEEHTSELQSRI